MKLIESLEREGGHIVVLMLLFLYCMAVLSLDPANVLAGKAGDMTLGALLLAMKGVGDKPKSSSYEISPAAEPSKSRPPAIAEGPVGDGGGIIKP